MENLQQNEEKVINIDFNKVLDSLRSTNSFANLEKSMDIFILERDTNKLMQALLRLFGDEIGNGLFHYFMAEGEINSIANKSLREPLAKLNNLKKFYGPLLQESLLKFMRPYFVDTLSYTGSLEQATTNLSVSRNDGSSLTVELDLNIALLLARNTMDVIINMYKKGGNTIDLNNFKEFILKMNEFAKTMTESVENSNFNNSSVKSI
ncbi:hypothetical protein [Cohnella thailandensis]|uniref:Uncharacterized protein n=1 Tax=Cohnella thailandensis TaxID=557557 RepID=A0A841SJQ6_9BACL|nr:hypothetical protein [Cohnella thailandensis]MBB6632743.1 hypothetical protein [Cohnella thailandensis]MBP1975568.1 hypothetical protein [Cohnella thailandensis]